jgi:CspA family cold shock protein
MGKYRDHRSSRGDRFNDREPEDSTPSYFQRRSATEGATPSPAQLPAPSLSVFEAEVLWFNAEKGFGFARVSDGSDAFLHISKLQAAGLTTLPEGAKLEVRIEVGHKGLQVGEVISVGVGQGSIPPPADADESAHEPASREDEGRGSVKWYDEIKGFGFVALENGGKDVFVHATTLTRGGLTTLEVGQAVNVIYCQGKKGLEARSIRLQ